MPVPASPPAGRLREKCLISALGMLYACSYFQRVAVPGTLFNEIQCDPALASGGELSASSIAWLGTLYLVIYGGMQLGVGLLTDRWGGIRVCLASGAMLAAGAIGFARADSLPELFAARILVSIGACAMYVPLIRELALRSSPARLGGRLALALSAGFGGGLAATYPTAWAVSLWGWRPVMTATALFTAAVWLAFCCLARGDRGFPEAEAGGTFSLPALWRVVVRRDMRLILTIGLLNFAGFFALAGSIGKKLLQDAAVFGSEGAAFVIMLVSVVAMAANCGAAALSRRSEGRTRLWTILLAASPALGSLIMIGLLAHGGATVFFAAPYLFFALSQGNSVLLLERVKRHAPSERFAQVVGFNNGMNYLAAAVSVSLSGLVLDAYRGGAVSDAAGIHYPAAAYQAFFGILLVIALGAAFAARQLRDAPQS